MFVFISVFVCFFVFKVFVGRFYSNSCRSLSLLFCNAGVLVRKRSSSPSLALGGGKKFFFIDAHHMCCGEAIGMCFEWMKCMPGNTMSILEEQVDSLSHAN